MSAKTESGFPAFLTALEEMTRQCLGQRAGAAAPLTRARHRTALNEAVAALNRVAADKPVELNAEELRLAARALGRITGRIDVEDVLDHIFREFCIGK